MVPKMTRWKASHLEEGGGGGGGDSGYRTQTRDCGVPGARAHASFPGYRCRSKSPDVSALLW
jgi:hypothetical protein